VGHETGEGSVENCEFSAMLVAANEAKVYY